MGTPAFAPCDIVVFGGTGDLTVRKLLPALYQRHRDGQLPDGTRVIACSRSGLDDAGYRDKIRGELPLFVPETDHDHDAAEAFIAGLEHVSIDVEDHASWAGLTAKLRHLGSGADSGLDSGAESGRVRVFYLACAPGLFGPISAGLAEHGLIDAQSRVVLEKPIGRDLASALAINDAVGAVFDESQIFRIDHYLGKESVQNLLVTRFANSVLEPLWNGRAIDHVQITVAESIGVGARAGYYDTSGALRDMVQNHLLQLLCLVAMEPPTQIDRDSVRDEKLKVLKALRPITASDAAEVTVTGQYASYAEECERPDSTTETFVALKVEIENWRWAGVPFYLRTGKCLDARTSEIVIQFRPVPHAMFPDAEGTTEPNRLVIALQPDEGIQLHLIAKEPGPGGIRLRRASLDLNYAATFSTRTPEAYERLLMDVVRGNPTLFMRRDEVEAAWTWTEPILAAWTESGRQPETYAAGTSGPTAATTLIERDGRTWHTRSVN